MIAATSITGMPARAGALAHIIITPAAKAASPERTFERFMTCTPVVCK